MENTDDLASTSHPGASTQPLVQPLEQPSEKSVQSMGQLSEPKVQPVEPPVHPLGQASAQPQVQLPEPPLVQPQAHSPVPPSVQPAKQPSVQPSESTSSPSMTLNSTSFANSTVPGSVITPVEVPVPTHPVINPPSQGGLGGNLTDSRQAVSSDSIFVSSNTSTSGPAEGELDAPIKAAAPVPGSIGSAISGPAAGQTPEMIDGTARVNNVSFNDPAVSTEDSQGANKEASPKKKNRTTLIALIIVAAMVVIALAAVLILQLG